MTVPFSIVTFPKGGPLLVYHKQLLSPYPETVRRATTRTAVRRNRLVVALADEVLIAHAHPGSKTAQLAAEVAGWGKPVWTLRHPSNVLPDVPAYDLA